MKWEIEHLDIIRMDIENKEKVLKYPSYKKKLLVSVREKLLEAYKLLLEANEL